MHEVHYMAGHPEKDGAVLYPHELPADHHAWGSLYIEACAGKVNVALDVLIGAEVRTCTLQPCGEGLMEVRLDDLGTFRFAVGDTPVTYAGDHPPPGGREMICLEPLDVELLEIAARLYDVTFIGRSRTAA